MNRARVLATLLQAELRQHLRDPLTLLFMVVLPLVLYPALGAAGHRAVAVAEAKAEARVLDVVVNPAIKLPENLHAIEGDPEAAVASGAAAAGASRTGDKVDLWWDSRSPDSLDARTRLVDALGRARRASAVRKVKSRDALTAAERTREDAARFLPILLLFTLLTGGVYTALDVITGERERGTVETLLSTAVDRRLVLVAKFGVVLLFTGSAAVLSLVSGWGSARFVLGLSVPVGAIALAALLFVPMAVLLAAVLTAAAAWAPDFKSGQALTTPLLLVPLALAAAPFVPGLQLTAFTALLPVTGLSLATRDVVAGHVDFALLALTFAAACAWAALALLGAARLLGREDVVLGTRGSGQRRLRGDYRPDALTLLGLAFLALWFIGQSAQAWDLRWGTVVTQVGLFLPLALAAPWWLGLPVRSTLRLAPGSLADWVRGAVVGLCLPGLALSVSEAQSQVFTAPASLFNGMFPENAPLWSLVVCFAVLPGLCEELLFRGAFFGLWRSKASPAIAVAVTALAFGAFHLSVFRFFPTTALGLVLGLLSLRTRSIGPGMLAHALNNAVSMVALGYGWDVQFSWPMVAIGAIAVAAAR